MSSTPDGSPRADGKQNDYWVSSLRIVLFILSLWALLSLGCGVLFREWLDNTLPNVGGAPFGFWMAQQGAIVGFLILLFLYMVLMDALDRKIGDGDQE
jgi:putative solute:sodium symporter small subunit